MTVLAAALGHMLDNILEACGRMKVETQTGIAPMGIALFYTFDNSADAEPK